MEVTGEYQIHSDRESVWHALNDPAVLEQCIPGCESLQRTGDNAFAAKVTAAIGPVRAKFNTVLSLENLNPPQSYRLVGESKSGAAGFGRGMADVQLEENADGTLLKYSAEFKVGGKLAQVGSRLVLGATKKTADDFFGAFSRIVNPETDAAEDEVAGHKVIPTTWLAVSGAALVLLIWWFLLR